MRNGHSVSRAAVETAVSPEELRVALDCLRNAIADMRRVSTLLRAANPTEDWDDPNLADAAIWSVEAAIDHLTGGAA
jgi:hypothetical protein